MSESDYVTEIIEAFDLKVGDIVWHNGKFQEVIDVCNYPYREIFVSLDRGVELYSIGDLLTLKCDRLDWRHDQFSRFNRFWVDETQMQQGEAQDVRVGDLLLRHGNVVDGNPVWCKVKKITDDGVLSLYLEHEVLPVEYLLEDEVTYIAR